MNATNGGPRHKRHSNDQYISNFAEYKAARIPYSRNHDSGVIGIYGGPYSHDIMKIFPNFDADPYNPESYDFACTDEAILTCLDAGTETFFRLGQTIEHQIKKLVRTVLPNDNGVVICDEFDCEETFTERLVTLIEPQLFDDFILVGNAVVKYDVENYEIAVSKEEHQKPNKEYETIYCLNFTVNKRLKKAELIIEMN